MAATDTNARIVAADAKKKAERQARTIVDLKAAGVVAGEVIRAGVGSYDYLVSLGSGELIHCTPVSSTSSNPFGYSEAFMPCEGASVLVAIGADNTKTGYILCTIPSTHVYKDGDDDSESSDDEEQDELIQPATFDEGPSYDSEDIYSTPVEDKDSGAVFLGKFRPVDVFPGEYVVMNEHGVGIDGDLFSMSIRGGNARIGASRIDDSVEIVCKNFTFYGSQHISKTHTELGCITAENKFAEYVGERTGGSGYKITQPSDTKTEKTEEEDEGGEEKEEKHLTGKYRLSTFLGYLGGLFSAFISRPDKNDEEATDDTKRFTDTEEPKDNGVLQFNVNDNGRVMLRTAGGFVLERSDRIPVPVRIRSTDDPAGMHPDDIVRDDTLYYEIPDDEDGNKSPHYSRLVLADKLAYDYKQTYERFLEQIASKYETPPEKSGDDFYLREEEDLEELKDDAGVPDRKVKPDELESNTGRRAGIYSLPSGEIILRDAWGSEIIMSGGNITINTPGSVITNTGHSSITRSGDDIVLRARNSIDVDASDHDVTIKGERNVRIVGGSDNTTEAGGVLIESLSTENKITMPDDKQGEDSLNTGIILKASKSHVSVVGKKTNLSADDELRVITGRSEDGNRSGKVTFSAGSVGISAEEGVLVSCHDQGFIVTDDAVAVAGDTISVCGKDGVMFTMDGFVGVPIWVEMEANFASIYKSRMDKYYNQEKTEDADSPLKLNDLKDNILFSYRTSEQCNTLKGLELTDTPETFTDYKPYWAVLADMKIGALKDVETEEWEQNTINEEFAWPGTDAYEDGHIARLDTDKEEETYNMKVKSVKMKTVNDDGEEEETDMNILCSKKFIDIAGDENSETKQKVVFDDLETYTVPVIDDDKDKKDKKDNKNGKNNTNNSNNK